MTGVVYFAGTVYWTGGVMAQYGGLSLPVAALVAGLLVAYLALFPAFFALALHVATRKFGPRALLLAPALWTATDTAASRSSAASHGCCSGTAR